MDTHARPYCGFQEFHLGESGRSGEHWMLIQQHQPEYHLMPDNEVLPGVEKIQKRLKGELLHPVPAAETREQSGLTSAAPAVNSGFCQTVAGCGEWDEAGRAPEGIAQSCWLNRFGDEGAKAGLRKEKEGG